VIGALAPGHAQVHCLRRQGAPRPPVFSVVAAQQLWGEQLMHPLRGAREAQQVQQLGRAQAAVRVGMQQLLRQLQERVARICT
jgi:hypothetical protein